MLKNQRTLGIVVALVSAVNFAISNTMTSLAYEGGSDPLTLSTTRLYPARGFGLYYPQIHRQTGVDEGPGKLGWYHPRSVDGDI